MAFPRALRLSRQVSRGKRTVEEVGQKLSQEVGKGLISSVSAKVAVGTDGWANQPVDLKRHVEVSTVIFARLTACERPVCTRSAGVRVVCGKTLTGDGRVPCFS